MLKKFPSAFSSSYSLRLSGIFTISLRYRCMYVFFRSGRVCIITYSPLVRSFTTACFPLNCAMYCCCMCTENVLLFKGKELICHAFRMTFLLPLENHTQWKRGKHSMENFQCSLSVFIHRNVFLLIYF